MKKKIHEPAGFIPIGGGPKFGLRECNCYSYNYLRKLTVKR